MKISKKWLSLSVAAIVLFSISFTAFAADFRVGERVSIQANERLTEDVYMTGGEVSHAGTVTGDFAGSGGSIIMNGSVTGDVLVAGGNITISGEVSDDIRVGGGNVLIQGEVGGDVLAGAGQLQLTGPGIGGDVVVGGGSIRIESPVLGKAMIGGGDIYINAPIGGDVRIYAERVVLGPKADIAGTLTYTAKHEATLEVGAVVRGKITFTEHARSSQRGIWGILSIALLIKFLSISVGALLLAFVFKKYAKALVEQAMKNPLREIGRGLIIMIVLPIASILLLVTIIGIPLGIIGILAFAMLMLFVCLAAPIVLGSLVHRWVSKGGDYKISWATVLLGAAIYVILGVIPFVGWILSCIVALLTLGAAMQIKWNVAKNWR